MMERIMGCGAHQPGGGGCGVISSSQNADAVIDGKRGEQAPRPAYAALRGIMGNYVSDLRMDSFFSFFFEGHWCRGEGKDVNGKVN